MLQQLWQDDLGALLSTEFVMFAALLVLGVTAGLVAVRNAVCGELSETADSVRSVSRAYRNSTGPVQPATEVPHAACAAAAVCP